MMGDDIIKAFITIQLLDKVPPSIRRKLIEKLLKDLGITFTQEEVKEMEEWFTSSPSPVFALSKKESTPFITSPPTTSQKERQIINGALNELDEYYEQQVKRRKSQEEDINRERREIFLKVTWKLTEPPLDKMFTKAQVVNILITYPDFFTSIEDAGKYFDFMAEKGQIYMVKPGYYKRM